MWFGVFETIPRCVGQVFARFKVRGLIFEFAERQV